MTYRSRIANTAATMKPTGGEMTRLATCLPRADHFTPSRPCPAAIPAPQRPPMSAWVELLGKPRYHVSRFQVMAPISADITTTSPGLIASTLAIKPGLVVVMSALIGAITWNLLTWYRGLPSSSTHALIGGLCGAGIAAAHGLDGVKWSALGRQVASLVISPPVGFIVAAVFAILLLYVIYRLGLRPAPVNRTLRSIQVLTAAFLSYSHGANDAQKTMAAITLALVAAGDLPRFEVPLWVVVLSAAAIGFGTYAGGWRIIRTLGWSILKLEPATARSAQLMGATVIQGATLIGLPVSTTHVITGAVMGVGISKKLSAVRWGLGANIVLAWIVTIPASGLIAWVAFAIFNTAGLRG